MTQACGTRHSPAAGSFCPCGLGGSTDHWGCPAELRPLQGHPGGFFLWKRGLSTSRTPPPPIAHLWGLDQRWVKAAELPRPIMAVGPHCLELPVGSSGGVLMGSSWGTWPPLCEGWGEEPRGRSSLSQMQEARWAGALGGSAGRM